MDESMRRHVGSSLSAQRMTKKRDNKRRSTRKGEYAGSIGRDSEKRVRSRSKYFKVQSRGEKEEEGQGKGARHDVV